MYRSPSTSSIPWSYRGSSNTKPLFSKRTLYPSVEGLPKTRGLGTDLLSLLLSTHCAQGEDKGLDSKRLILAGAVLPPHIGREDNLTWPEGLECAYLR